MPCREPPRCTVAGHERSPTAICQRRPTSTRNVKPPTFHEHPAGLDRPPRARCHERVSQATASSPWPLGSGSRTDTLAPHRPVTKHRRTHPRTMLVEVNQERHSRQPHPGPRTAQRPRRLPAAVLSCPPMLLCAGQLLGQLPDRRPDCTRVRATLAPGAPAASDLRVCALAFSDRPAPPVPPPLFVGGRCLVNVWSTRT